MRKMAKYLGAVLLFANLAATPAWSINLEFLDNAVVVGMSDADRELLRNAARKLLEERQDDDTIAWSNPESDAHGRLKVTDTHEDYDTTCRVLLMHNRVEGREGRAVVRVCRKGDEWKLAPRRTTE